MEQNYFQFDHQHYKQTHRLFMGAPTSSALAEAYYYTWNINKYTQSY
jgi:hypothetical protein